MKKGKDNTKTLDLHGYQQDEVFSAVDSFLLKNQQQKRVRIIPGKGKGLVKQKVIAYLKQAHYPYEMENEGSLIVFMD